MVELVLEDYCQECREMDIKTKISDLLPGEISSNGRVMNTSRDEVVYISLYCSKAKRCAAQVQYLERRFKANANAGK